MKTTTTHRGTVGRLATMGCCVLLICSSISADDAQPSQDSATGRNVACCGQGKQAEQKKQASAATVRETEEMICPVYPYMFHGSYVSYYAVKHPGCTEGVPYDGPSQDPADCEAGTGCHGVAVAKRRETKDGGGEEKTRGVGFHQTHPDTERDGIDPPYQENIDAGIAVELDEGVKHIRFPKSGSGGGGGQMVRAKVWFIKVKPIDKPAVFCGVGYQVDAGEVDRTSEEGEVVVVDRSGGNNKRVSVLVLTKKGQQIWRPYNILLLK